MIVFDDFDKVWKNEDTVNILKAILDTKEKRVVSWVSRNFENVTKMTEAQKREYFAKLEQQIADGVEQGDTEIDDDGKEVKVKVLKLPNQFEFKGSAIFISNLDQDKLDPAVLTRGPHIDVTLTVDELFERMTDILPGLGNPSLSMEEKHKVLDIIKDYWKRGLITKKLSMRTYVLASDAAASGDPDWMDIIDIL